MADFTNPKAENPILSDLQDIVTLTQANAKMDPTGCTNIPTGCKRFVAVTGGYQLQTYNGTTWSNVGKLIHNVDQLDNYHANTGTTANTIPVRNSSGQLPGSITGNAATATKWQTARTIDIGGIATATEQSVDGSANVVIPITQITVNNESDNAINGVLSIAHGGTGRTDGAAQDVVVSSAQGTVKASAHGQIGDAVNKTGTDLNTFIVSGNYLFRGGTVALHFPRNISEKTCTTLKVSRAGKHILQVLTCSDGDVWIRRSVDIGSSWVRWQAAGGIVPVAAVTIFVSKSGSDDNTGLDSANPVASISRAIQIATGYAPRGGTALYVKLCIGEGDWGSITIEVPFYIYIYPYDGAAATEYVSSLPVFTSLRNRGSHVKIYGAVIETLTSHHVGYTTLEGYARVASLYAEHGGQLGIAGNSTVPIDIISKTNHLNVLRVYNNGTLFLTGSRTIRVIESLSLSGQFESANSYGQFILLNLMTIELADGVSVTGTKYSISVNSITTQSKSELDALPGTVAGSIASACIIQSGMWGGGNSHYLLCGDAQWRQDSSFVNAQKAEKLTTARTIQTNLASASAASFDGSANVTPGVTGVLAIANGGTGNTAGLAASATILATARTIRTNLASTTAVSFNGSANITPGVTGVLPIANGGTGSTVGAVLLSGNQTVAGTKTFSSSPVVPSPATSDDSTKVATTAWVRDVVPSLATTTATNLVNAARMTPGGWLSRSACSLNSTYTARSNGYVRVEQHTGTNGDAIFYVNGLAVSILHIGQYGSGGQHSGTTVIYPIKAGQTYKLTGVGITTCEWIPAS